MLQESNRVEWKSTLNDKYQADLKSHIILRAKACRLMAVI